MKLFRKYGKSISIFVLVAIVVSSFLVAVNVFNPTAAEACHDQGCNVSFWQTHTDKWVTIGPWSHLNLLFSGADLYQLGGTTLLNALAWNVLPIKVRDAAKMLLREGIAARLNISNPDISYHLTTFQVTEMVNNALASGNLLTIVQVTKTLNNYNNLHCPFR